VRIRLACVGDLRLPGAEAMQAEYLKRLKRYGKVELVEVRASKRRELERRRAEEAEALERACEGCDLRVALEVGGKRLDSPGLAARLEAWAVEGRSRVVFLVGGSDGLAPELSRGAQLRLSLSDMTFPHQLFRVMLLEQLYRARTIQRGEPYHK